MSSFTKVKASELKKLMLNTVGTLEQSNEILNDQLHKAPCHWWKIWEDKSPRQLMETEIWVNKTKLSKARDLLQLASASSDGFVQLNAGDAGFYLRRKNEYWKGLAGDVDDCVTIDWKPIDNWSTREESEEK